MRRLPCLIPNGGIVATTAPNNGVQVPRKRSWELAAVEVGEVTANMVKPRGYLASRVTFALTRMKFSSMVSPIFCVANPEQKADTLTVAKV